MRIEGDQAGGVYAARRGDPLELGAVIGRPALGADQLRVARDPLEVGMKVPHRIRRARAKGPAHAGAADRDREDGDLARIDQVRVAAAEVGEGPDLRPARARAEVLL